MDDIHNLTPAIKDISEAQSSIQQQITDISGDVDKDNIELASIKERVNLLLKRHGNGDIVEFEECDLNEVNKVLRSRLIDFDGLTEADKALGLSSVDYIVAALAGGMAVVIDFLLVKIPQNMKYEGKFDQEGSPLTELLRKIGRESDGKEAKWIGVFEKWFHVNYDPSIKEGVFGPRNHRIYSGGHDPSPAGLIFAIKDILSGTFTYFDKSGRLVIEKAAEMELWKKCIAPIMWLGHLLSDLFTSAGVPVPGGCLLRAIQVGEFGKKGRTFGELMDWMFMKGYDMRHLATMSICNAAMHLVIGLYLAFVSPLEESDSKLVSEREFVEIRKNERSVKMKFVASSVAVAGNISKICVYEGNPLAFNYSVWYEMIKHSITEIEILTKDRSAETAIEKRHIIDENFDVLLSNVIS